MDFDGIQEGMIINQIKTSLLKIYIIDIKYILFNQSKTPKQNAVRSTLSALIKSLFSKNNNYPLGRESLH
jgi:hypothetical protein